MEEIKGVIPRSFIDELLARADIVQLINQRVPLKKAGTNYKACCPFHSEKTPSFNVSAQKQFYHCFGCGSSGDALKFLMEYEGLSFIDSIEQLASINGMQVPREKLSPQEQEKQQKQRDLYDVTLLVAKYYRQQLKNHVASTTVKDYLKNRGLSAEIAKDFYIGFAPNDKGLEKELHANSLLKEQLIETGMLGENEGGGVYSRFRDRLMFPIRDVRGRVIAFGGRVLSEQQQPKYLNSPETPIFHKSYTLYGLYEMRIAKDRSNHVIVVEGYMDVVALAQFGVKNAVATLGTAVTVEHLDILFRQVSEVVFCFDGDNAGKKAAWKALELVLPLLTEIRLAKFLFLDAGEDPDSTVRKEGLEGFTKRVVSGMTSSEFLFAGLQEKISLPLSSIEGQQQLISLAKPYIISARGAMPDLLTKVLADIVELPVWRLGQILEIRVASTKKIKEKSKQLFVLKAQSIILQLLAVILKRPDWALIFEDDFLASLKQSSNAEFRFLEQAIQVLKNSGFIIETLIDWLMEPNRHKVLIQIRQIPLQNKDEFLEVQFDEIIMQIVKYLEEEKIKKNIRAKIGN
jgi:DNA primase